MARILVALLFVALIACKRSAPKQEPKPAEPSITAEQALELARTKPPAFDGATLIVSGKVLKVRAGSGGVPSSLDLEAGKGEILPAGMTGETAPAVGTETKLKCLGVIVAEKPRLMQCEPEPLPL
jgi:hypothetical protein